MVLIDEDDYREMLVLLYFIRDEGDKFMRHQAKYLLDRLPKLKLEGSKWLNRKMKP